MRGGRGSGKTRTGAETLAGWIANEDGGEWAIVAPTFGDGKSVCVEGPSGLLRALGGLIENWNRSEGVLYVRNGAKVYIDGGDDGALRIQGKNLRGAWCDEVGLWKDWKTSWEESLRYAVRIPPARIIATGTPKRGNKLVVQLMEDPRVVKTHMRMLDNAANLAPAIVEELLDLYAGTTLGRQELEGELIDVVEGALWTSDALEALRVQTPPSLSRIVVGVDPSGSSKASADAAGVVVAGHSTETGHGYALADHTVHGSPDAWARAAVSAYYAFEADRIVVETNYGGEMVEAMIRTVDPSVPVRAVRASRGKLLRAEPVAALYEQGRIHHVGYLTELEDEMCTWTPESKDSPNRLDALVWALTDLMIAPRSATVETYAPNGQAPVIRRGDLTLIGSRYIDS